MPRDLISSYEAAHLLGLKSVSWAERCLQRCGYTAQLHRAGILRIVKMWRRSDVDSVCMLRETIKDIRRMERDEILQMVPEQRINVTQTLLANMAKPHTPKPLVISPITVPVNLQLTVLPAMA